jgi:hypothetical protein
MHRPPSPDYSPATSSIARSSPLSAPACPACCLVSASATPRNATGLRRRASSAGLHRTEAADAAQHTGQHVEEPPAHAPARLYDEGNEVASYCNTRYDRHTMVVDKNYLYGWYLWYTSSDSMYKWPPNGRTFCLEKGTHVNNHVCFEEDRMHAGQHTPTLCYRPHTRSRPHTTASTVRSTAPQCVQARTNSWIPVRTRVRTSVPWYYYNVMSQRT